MSTTPNDYMEDWQRYWRARYDTGRRLELEHAATDPVGRWVTVDVRELADEEVDVVPHPLYDAPDEVLGTAREAFENVVDENDLGPPETGSYDLLPVHLTGVGDTAGRRPVLDDPIADANTVTLVESVPAPDQYHRETRAGVVVYRCPAGHETSLQQRLYRHWTVETCGQPDCLNEVTVVDTETGVRQVIEFTVPRQSGDLSCIATGRYAGALEVFDRLVSADRLSMTGIARPVVTESGRVEPVYELLHVEPA